MWELSRRVVSCVSNLLQNYFSRFIPDCQSSPSFSVFKIFISRRLLHHRKFGFFHFLSVNSTDKPVSRSKHAYALTQLNVFAFKGFFLSWYLQKQGRSLSKSGNKIQKICGGKMYSRMHTFGAEVHKSNIRVTRWHNKYKILNCIERHNFCLSDLLTNSNRTTLQSYKVEERTFGTPCRS